MSRLAVLTRRRALLAPNLQFAVSHEYTANPLHSVLLIFTLLSFLPQIRRLHDRSNSAAGISITYAAINLIVATEQLAFGLHIITIDPQLAYEGITHAPLTIGDWLNVLQFVAVWLGHGIIFIDILRLSPSRPGAKSAAVLVYSLFLPVSLVPYVIESFLPQETPDSDVYHDRSWFTAIFGGVHSYFVTPPVTVLALLAVIPQARVIAEATAPGALSLAGLAWQAIVFMLVGISWMFRLTLPRDFWRGMETWHFLYTWHNLVGWAAVYNLIFAFGQAVLYGVAWYYESATKVEGETRPLLS